MLKVSKLLFLLCRYKGIIKPKMAQPRALTLIFYFILRKSLKNPKVTKTETAF